MGPFCEFVSRTYLETATPNGASEFVTAVAKECELHVSVICLVSTRVWKFLTMAPLWFGRIGADPFWTDPCFEKHPSRLRDQPCRIFEPGESEGEPPARRHAERASGAMGAGVGFLEAHSKVKLGVKRLTGG